MPAQHIPSDCVNWRMALASYDRLDDGSSSGRAPPRKVVIAFSATLSERAADLGSTNEAGALAVLKLRHPLPAQVNWTITERIK